MTDSYLSYNQLLTSTLIDNEATGWIEAAHVVFYLFRDRFLTGFNKCLFRQSFPFWLLRAGFALGPPAARRREWMGQLPLKS